MESESKLSNVAGDPAASDTKLYSKISSVVSKAASTLENVRRRRIHLDNNLEAIGRTQYSQSVFEVLQRLGENGCSLEKARIQARIIDAITSAAQKKVVLTSRRNVAGYSAPSGSSRANTKRPTVVDRHRGASQSPARPSSVQPLIDFLGTDLEGDTDVRGMRSVSPTWHQAPWRINRTRVKRPGYPRLVNDPVPARRATVRLGTKRNDPITVIQGPVVRLNESASKPTPLVHRLPKTVRFRTNEPQTPQSQLQNTTRSTDDMRSLNQTTRVKLGIIPLGRSQYSAQTESTMASLISDQIRERDLANRDFKVKRDAAVEFRSLDVTPVPVLQSTMKIADSSSSTDLESIDQTGNQPRWIDGLRPLQMADTHAMIDAAVSSHIDTPVGPSSPQNPEERLPTPQTSPDLTEHSVRRSVTTPIHSPDRSVPSHLDACDNTSPLHHDYRSRQMDAGTCYESESDSDRPITTPESSPTAHRPTTMRSTPSSPRSIHIDHPTRAQIQEYI
ncbi:unnamed protein product [Echinostoma caproni]|uniref:JmjC domain-containing protein n=1 Tax=Echinostoma caproni TaxID=27848 RepID=A0A183AIA0_9TREM|nr:unnamed protein product [Echinostoma caproni]